MSLPIAIIKPQPASRRPWVTFMSVVLMLMTCSLPAQAQNAPGSNLPRFVSVGASEARVRVGPGTEYDIQFEFHKAGLPVEVTQEYDVWRRIRYFDGAEGWIHQTLLSSRRSALVRPWDEGSSEEPIKLFLRAESQAPASAWLVPGFLVSVSECDGAWCEVTGSGPDVDGNQTRISGFIPQLDLWGVYPGETFD